MEFDEMNFLTLVLSYGEVTYKILCTNHSLSHLSRDVVPWDNGGVSD